MYKIFRIDVSRPEEHLWKFSLQTNKCAKSYRIGNYVSICTQRIRYASFRTLCAFEHMCQSAPKVLNDN